MLVFLCFCNFGCCVVVVVLLLFVLLFCCFVLLLLLCGFFWEVFFNVVSVCVCVWIL